MTDPWGGSTKTVNAKLQAHFHANVNCWSGHSDQIYFGRIARSALNLWKLLRQGEHHFWIVPVCAICMCYGFTIEVGFILLILLQHLYPTFPPWYKVAKDRIISPQSLPTLKDPWCSNPLKCPGRQAGLVAPLKDLQGGSLSCLFRKPIPKSQSHNGKGSSQCRTRHPKWDWAVYKSNE